MNGSRFAAIALGALCASSLANVAAQPVVTIVMSGLDNPRGLAISPNGALYVTEAGRGLGRAPGPGDWCGYNAPGEFRCYGPTGAVTRLWNGVQQRVAEGLPSNALPDGSSASGPNGISFLGTGGAYIPIGLGDDLGFRDELGPAGPLFGTLVHMAASGQWRVVADISLHEDEENPAGGPIDSNPFGVLAEPRARLVADAGANALLSVGPDGSIETVAVFPNRATGRGTDSVPTSVVRGPDGALYVGELSGVPFAAGAANIYRLVPGEAPTVHASGFKMITDIVFGSDGSLYVIEHASGPVFFAGPGKLTRVAPDGSRSTVLDGLDRPTAVVVTSDGTIYVTNHGITPGAGTVLMISP